MFEGKESQYPKWTPSQLEKGDGIHLNGECVTVTASGVPNSFLRVTSKNLTSTFIEGCMVT